MHRHGFSLVELSLVMGLLGILGLWISPLLLTGTRTVMYLPHVTQVNQAGHDLLNAVVEGSQIGSATGWVPGLRMSRQLANGRRLVIGRPNEIEFLIYRNNSDDNVNIRWNAAWKRMERRVDNGAPESLPYYAAQGLDVLIPSAVPPPPPIAYPNGCAIFRYYAVSAGGAVSELLPRCANGSLPSSCPSGSPPVCSDASTPQLSATDLTNVDRVDVRLQVQTGSGDPDMGDAALVATSSVALRIPR